MFHQHISSIAFDKCKAIKPEYNSIKKKVLGTEHTRKNDMENRKMIAN